MPGKAQAERLDSWKEIAEYLGRDVRTVIRWKNERGLPVRRLPGGKRQSVFALTAEIDDWLLQQEHPATGGATTVAANDDRSPETAAPGGVSVKPRRPRAFWPLSLAGAALAIVLLGWAVGVQKHAANSLRGTEVSENTVRLGTVGRPLQFTRTNVETGVGSYRFAAADLNGDRTLDLVFTSSPGEVVGVLQGKGNGTFLPARLYEDCPQSDGLVVADLNRDGIPDIAVACFASDSILVLWGKGDGTFPQRSVISIPGGPRFLAGGDVNNDGWPDLVVASFGDAALYVVMNHEGRFAPALISRFEAVAAVAVADLDKDGVAVVIASVRERGKFGLAVFKGSRDGWLRKVRLLPTGETWRVLAVTIQPVDVNGDGIPDILASLLNGQVIVHWGAAGGEFSAPSALVAGSDSMRWRSFAFADLDLDGKPDLLLTSAREHSLEFYTGTGKGNFSLSGSASVGIFPMSPIVADFNNDGFPDVFVNSPYQGASLLLSNGAPNASSRSSQ